MEIYNDFNICNILMLNNIIYIYYIKKTEFFNLEIIKMKNTYFAI